MALAATIDIDVRSTGVDTSGGGWNTAAAGVDYSQQDAAQQTIDLVTNTAIVHTTTTQIQFATYTPSANDVGNIIQVTGGTATAGFYEITAADVANKRWTCDRSLGTSAQTISGAMGGGLKTIGKAGAVPIVAGNKILIKYHASNVYTSTSTTANVSDGRLSISVGSATAPVTVSGYQTTHGDDTGNWPTIRWGVNAASTAIIGFTGIFLAMRMNIDGNRANFTSTRGIGATAVTGGVIQCKIFNCSASGFIATGGTHLVHRCEFTNCTAAGAIRIATASQECVVSECYIHDNGIDGIAFEQAIRLVLVRNVFDTNTGTHFTFNTTAITDGPFVYHNTFYAATSHAANLNGSTTPAVFSGNLFEANGGYGVNCSAAGTHPGVVFRYNGFYNNTSGKYDTTKILSYNVAGEVNNTTGTFFVDAANADFRLNNLPNQGASARSVVPTYPGLPSVATALDLGAYQHADFIPAFASS